MEANRPFKGLVLVIGYGLLLAGRAFSWPQPPYVWISDWIKYAHVGGQVEFLARDYSGTYITNWWWNPADSPTSTTGYYAQSRASYSFGSAGVYYCFAYARNVYNLQDYDYGVAIVIDVRIDNDPPGRDTDDYMAYQGSPADIYYTINPNSWWLSYYTRYVVDLVIRGQSGQAIRTVRLGAGLGQQYTTWDGKRDDGTWAPPGSYTATIRLTIPGRGEWSSGPHQITVVKVDLDIDTDNDGVIEESEDSIEEYPPGAIIPTDLDQGRFTMFRKEIRLTVAPVLPNSQVVLDAGPGVEIWTAALTGAQVILPKIYSPGEVPSSLWVDGNTAGSLVDITLTYKDSQGYPITDDKVKVFVVETVSWAPVCSIASSWASIGTTLMYRPDDEFVAGIVEQGYTALQYVDAGSEYDGDCGSCTLSNYKALASSGALLVFNHGSHGVTYPIGFDSKESCLEWINGESGMNAQFVSGNKWYVEVKSSWLESNWKGQLDNKRAFVFWASCHSSSVMGSAGGRTVFGYQSAVNNTDAAIDIGNILWRMSGLHPFIESRTAGAAYSAGGLSYSLVMSGGAGYRWTTLCPAPIAKNATWPRPDSGRRQGWGCIIFDTYVDISNPATSALVCESGGPISEVQWCGNTGYGHFILGFKYDNTSGQGASLRCEADYCTDMGGKKLDGDRKAPNGDDRSWQY